MKSLAIFLLALALALGENAPRQTLTFSPTLPPTIETETGVPTVTTTQVETQTQVATETQVPTETTVATETAQTTVPTETTVATETTQTTVPTQTTVATETTQTTAPTETTVATETVETTVATVPTETVIAPTTPPATTPGFVCDSDSCCADNQQANEQSGEGFLRFNERCLQGGLHCVDNTGCELCSRDGNSNGLNRPRCDAPLTCGTQECCQSLQDQVGQGESLRASGRCLMGGPRCFESSGCEFCATDINAANVTFAPCDDNVACPNQICCSARANPNPETGDGYLVFNSNCEAGAAGGLHCVAETGCSLCFRAPEGGGGNNLGDRPDCPTEVTAQGLTIQLEDMMKGELDPLDSAATSLVAGIVIVLGLFIARVNA